MFENHHEKATSKRRGFFVYAMPLFIAVFTALFLSLLLFVPKAGSGTLPSTLLGSGNDVISVFPDARPTTEHILMRDLVLSGRDSWGLGRETPGLAVLCLQNGTDGSETAFDNAKGITARYSAAPGTAICGRFEPTRHDFLFYKREREGKLSLVLSGKLDLTDFQGRLITLWWQSQPSAER
ncbi:MAG: hypothetical protein ABJN26_20645 [Stappiaceae bacterium]